MVAQEHFLAVYDDKGTQVAIPTMDVQQARRENFVDLHVNFNWKMLLTILLFVRKHLHRLDVIKFICIQNPQYFFIAIG